MAKSRKNVLQVAQHFENKRVQSKPTILIYAAAILCAADVNVKKLRVSADAYKRRKSCKERALLRLSKLTYDCAGCLRLRFCLYCRASCAMDLITSFVLKKVLLAANLSGDDMLCLTIKFVLSYDNNVTRN